MPSLKLLILVASLALLCLMKSTAAKTISADDPELLPIQDPELISALDDGNVETALLNYLFAKQIMARLRSNVSAQDLLKKRSYWKQCAFNAVSCFGK